MSVPTPLKMLCALLLGVGASLLVACGESGSGQIPSVEAGELKGAVAELQEAASGDDCTRVEEALTGVRAALNDIGDNGDIDQRLRRRLREGVRDKLVPAAERACRENAEPEPTESTPETTTTAVPTTTTAVPTTPEETTPTVPPAETTDPPEEEVPPLPPDPGGTPPEGDGDLPESIG